MCLASCAVFFGAPEVLGASWAEVLAALGLISGALHGVAATNTTEQTTE